MDFNYPNILNLFPEHLHPKRSESASFLIWYLENYYRLDSREAVDAVCDQNGDKGIDGIFVNDSMQTIIVYQSRISQKNATVGDTGLKEFAGTLTQLKDTESINKLIESAGKAEVAGLLKRLEVAEKIDDYELRGEFLSNIELDTNGKAFIGQSSEVSFVGRIILESSYISDKRDNPIHAPISFDVSSFQITEYTVDADSKALIAPVRARELIKLEGIENQSLFVHNVRGPLGRTTVNKAISKSVGEPELHKKFPLFHNGITVIAGTIDATDEKISISDYFVVNGCQSLTSLFLNQVELTDNLYVLAKFIEVDPASLLAKQITEFSNNQNGVKPRDFKANSSPQIRIQNEFRLNYPGIYEYAIKRGEEPQEGIVISNEDAGLYLMAFDLMQPWATHRKYQIFDDKHSEIFGRPEVGADRIVMCQVIREIIDEILEDINNQLLAKYVLARYLLIYLVRKVLDAEKFGHKLIHNPKDFVRDSVTRDKFRNLVTGILRDIVTDLNIEVAEYGDNFDYREKLRDETWVKKLTRDVVAQREKLVRRGNIKSIDAEWESL